MAPRGDKPSEREGATRVARAMSTMYFSTWGCTSTAATARVAASISEADATGVMPAASRSDMKRSS